MDVITNLNPRWASLPEVVNLVLQNLSAKNLRSCAQVCSSWRNLARHIIKRRTKICWYFYAWDQDDRSCETAFEDYMNNMAIEPKFALIFMSSPPPNTGNECEPSAKHPYTEKSDLLKHLPLSCCSSFCVVDYVSGTTSDCKTTQTKNWQDGQALTAVFFPTLPGFEVYKCELIGDVRETLHDHIDIPDNQILKWFLLLLAVRRHMNRSLLLLNNFKTSNIVEGYTATAIYCGKVDNVPLRERNSFQEERSFAIAFTGDSISIAFVTILHPEGPAELETKFKQLSETHPFQGQCIAFAFTDLLARRRFAYNDENGPVFRKLFPTIPLFTIVGLGLINFPFSVTNRNFDIDLPQYGQKTCFMIMSFKN